MVLRFRRCTRVCMMRGRGWGGGEGVTSRIWPQQSAACTVQISTTGLALVNTPTWCGGAKCAPAPLRVLQICSWLGVTSERSESAARALAVAAAELCSAAAEGAAAAAQLLRDVPKHDPTRVNPRQRWVAGWVGCCVRHAAGRSGCWSCALRAYKLCEEEQDE